MPKPQGDSNEMLSGAATPRQHRVFPLRGRKQAELEKLGGCRNVVQQHKRTRLCYSLGAFHLNFQTETKWQDVVR